MSLPKFSFSPVPASSLKRRPQNEPLSLNFNYSIYQCHYVLRVKSADVAEPIEKGVDIVKSCFEEFNDGFVLVLVCSNGSLLLQRREENNLPLMKQLNWFQNPQKNIVGLCIEPSRCNWILAVCADSSLYLVPLLAQIKQEECLIEDSPLKTDLSTIQYSKPIKGEPTYVVWWHTLDNQDVGIISSDIGELVFVDIAQHQEVGRTAIKEKIVKLQILQDMNDRTTYLYIHTLKAWTIQLLLEQPSPKLGLRTPSSLSQAFDMGYDMVAEYNMESILTVERSRDKDEMLLQSRSEVLPHEFSYTLHKIDGRTYIAKQDQKYNVLEIFSDIKQTPQYIYHLPGHTSLFALCGKFIMTINKDNNQVQLKILSRQLSNTTFGRQGLKKLDPSLRTDVQTFQLLDGETVIDNYKYFFKEPPSWSSLFPHSAGYSCSQNLYAYLIVTKDGVMECKPHTSPECYFADLAMKNGTEISNRLGLMFELNAPLLYEFIGDKFMNERDIQRAVDFYKQSKCPPLKRALQLVRYAPVTDSLIFTKQVLKKEPNNLTSKQRKDLSNMAFLCYIQQIVENYHSGSFFKNLTDSFKSFICDNFDYDEETAMDNLIKYGLVDQFFEVAKTRGVIGMALDKMANHGNFLLNASIQTMLLDCGYAEILFKSQNGVFLKHMHPEEATKFLLAQSEVSRQFIEMMTSLLTQLSEMTLLQVTRMLDPSRPFIKPILEKAQSRKRHRTNSWVSLNSSLSVEVDDDSVSVDMIVTLFLKSVIVLNAARNTRTLPNLRLLSHHLSGQLSWTGSVGRSDSVVSNEILVSEVARMRVACGSHHVAFITNDKKLYTWGRSLNGRLGHGDLLDEKGVSPPFRVESLHMHGIQLLSVACGHLHTVALCEEGVYAWGSNKYGQLGIGDTRTRSRPVLVSHISGKQLVSIVCGDYHTLAITADHKLYAWGWGIHGQLGVRSVENQLFPKHVALLDKHRVIQVAAGYAHSAALTSQGYIFTFGAGLYGQLGTGTNTKQVVPQLVETLITDSIYLIACGRFETIAVSDEQTIFYWGRNHHQYHICGKAENSSYGRRMANNTGDVSHRYFPEDMPFKLQQPITQIFCGNWHYIALTAMNYVYTWGYNDCGQLGHYNKINQPAPRLVKALSRRCIVQISAGAEFSVAVDNDENVLAWGRNDDGLIGVENENAPTSPVARRSVFSVLAPTSVPGLPISADLISLTSNLSFKRESVFDQQYNLPDLSTVGRDQLPYGVGAALLSIYRLFELYPPTVIERFALHMRQWFILSFCHEIQQNWNQAFTYREKAVRECSEMSDGSLDHGLYEERMCQVTEDLLNKFEDFVAEDFEEDSSLVAMVMALKTIFDVWLQHDLQPGLLEDILQKHMEILSPLYTIVMFGYLGNLATSSPTLRFSLYRVQQKHSISEKFSCLFYTHLLSRVMESMATGSNWYSFLGSLSDGLDRTEHSPTSRDESLKEIVEYKRKILSAKPFINISNAVTTTLSAAAKAHNEEVNFPGFPHLPAAGNNMKKTADVALFTCSHNLLRCYTRETVLPEFRTRMCDLPQPLPYTADVLARLYDVTDACMPVACPYCVYNNFRNEQLHVMKERGMGTSNQKSTMWEI